MPQDLVFLNLGFVSARKTKQDRLRIFDIFTFCQPISRIGAKRDILTFRRGAVSAPNPQGRETDMVVAPSK